MVPVTVMITVYIQMTCVNVKFEMIQKDSIVQKYVNVKFEMIQKDSIVQKYHCIVEGL